MGCILMLIIRQEHRDPPIEIDVGSEVYAVTFSANGEYLLSGGDGGVQVWQVEDGTQVARMGAGYVSCLAVSKDGRWIATGTWMGETFVWDAKTHKQVFKNQKDSYTIKGVDFSPNSTRLLSASNNKTASIWDIPTRKRVQTLRHDNFLTAAKYSPQGNRIATATEYCIRVWDSKDGRLLLDIKVGVTPLFNTGLFWSNKLLFVISGSRIQKIDACTGSVVSAWSVPDSDYRSCIALPKHGQSITYSANRFVTFWDTSSHTQLGRIQHPQDIRSTALSPDDEFIAIGGEEGEVIINSPSSITVGVLFRSIVEYTGNSDLSARRIRSLCLVYTQHSSNQSLRSMTPRSIHGGSISSRTQKHH